MTTSNPLILTLVINAEAQTYFDELRIKHFPPEKNYLNAHLTLFHHLPAYEPQIIQDILTVCSENDKLVLRATGVRNMGRGVAFKVENEVLSKLHNKLQQQWLLWLIPQDKQRLFPHITIQNKVDPDIAKLLQQKLEKEFISYEFYGTGLSLWEYLGGPWRFIATYHFRS